MAMETHRFFELIASRMVGELELIKLQPKELRGRAREVLIRSFLKPYLPDSLDIGQGVITSVEGGQSGELDVIIYDRSGYNLFKPFTYYMPEGSKPFPSEVVYAVIEVEDRLTSGRLSQCIERIELAKRLPKSAYYEHVGPIQNYFNLYGKEWEYFPTLGIVFAFDSEPLTKLRSLLEQNNLEKKESLEKQVDLICVLKRGLIVYYSSKKGLLAFPPEPKCELKYREGKPGENLSLFYRMIMRVLTQVWTRAIRVNDYFK